MKFRDKIAMITSDKALLAILTKLKQEGVSIDKENLSINLNIDLDKACLRLIKPLVYTLLNNFENLYFISITDIPYCLMPDAAHHIVHIKKGGENYVKYSLCNKCRYKDLCPGQKKSLKQKFIPSPVPDLPDEVILEITQRCNLECPLCFRNKGAIDIPFKKVNPVRKVTLSNGVKNIIDDCVRLGIKDIRFTGGEPLFYEEIGRALSYAKAKGLYVTLNTNATVLNKDIKNMLKNYVDNILIPLQGFNPQSEERLTGSKVDFIEKLKNIMELNRTVPLVRIGTIISQTLCKNLNGYCRLIKELKIKNWELYRPLTKRNIKEFDLSKPTLVKLINQLYKIRQKEDIGPHILNPVPFCITNNYSLNSYVLFGAARDEGHSRIVLDSKGFRPSYSIHRYLGRTIEEAWRNPFLRKIRALNYLAAKCQSCFYLNWCKGGSRYLAKVKYGSYFYADPLMSKK